MGINFEVDVNIKPTGDEKLNNIEKQIERIQQLGSKPIDLNFNVSDSIKDISSMFKEIEKSASTSGNKAANSFKNGFKRFSSNSNSIVKDIEKINKKINDSTYNAILSKNTKELSRYNDIKEPKFDKALKQVRAYRDEYENILSELNRHFDASNTFSLDDSKIVKYGERLEYLRSSFKNTLSILKDDIAFDNLSKITPKLKEFENINSKFSDVKSSILSAGSEQLGSVGYEKLTANISLAEAAQSRLNAELSKGSNANLDSIIADTKELNQLTTKLNSEYQKLSRPADTIAQNKVMKDLMAFWKRNSKAWKDFGTDYENLIGKLSHGTLSQGALNDVKARIGDFQSNIKAAGKTGRSFGEDIKRGFKQIGQFATTYGLLQNVLFEVPSKMIQAVQDVDKAKIELTKVSEAPTSQLNKYWDEATVSAKKYGAAISEVITSTADWSRLGYKLDDAKELSDATTLLSRIGDNMTQESSASGMISTLKGFELEADQALSIVDKVNEVANTQPIDTSGIFSGLERSASSMNAANNSLEQTIALITAANSVVQDADVVGTSFKTISMRLRGASTELEDAGLDTEGMAESTAKLREEIESLSGVDIMINDNTFKSTYDILDELSRKWEDLTDIQRASVTELIAGKHQGNVMSALMSNFDIARETLNTALYDSEGSAERELENWNKGIEASLERFKAQFQDFSTTSLSSGLFKGIVDSGTGALSILTDMVDTFGALAPLLGGFLTKNGMGKRNAALYKIRQNNRRLINVENSAA